MKPCTTPILRVFHLAPLVLSPNSLSPFVEANSNYQDVQDPAITNVESIQQRMLQDPAIRRELAEINAGRRPTFSRETARKLQQFDEQVQQIGQQTGEPMSIFPELPALPPRQP